MGRGPWAVGFKGALRGIFLNRSLCSLAGFAGIRHDMREAHPDLMPHARFSHFIMKRISHTEKRFQMW